jgi:hypothetical protein
MRRGRTISCASAVCVGALTEAERYAVADDVVEQLKERGDPRQLSQDAEPKNGMPTTR